MAANDHGPKPVESHVDTGYEKMLLIRMVVQSLKTFHVWHWERENLYNNLRLLKLLKHNKIHSWLNSKFD